MTSLTCYILASETNGSNKTTVNGRLIILLKHDGILHQKYVEEQDAPYDWCNESIFIHKNLWHMLYCILCNQKEQLTISES